MPRVATRHTLFAALCLGWAVPSGALAETAGEPTAASAWQFTASDARYRVEALGPQSAEGRDRGECDFASLTAAAGGAYIYLERDVGRLACIPELRPSLWLKSDRAGVQFFARVALPNTRELTGQPVTLLVEGMLYDRVGYWQQLSLRDLPLSLERQARVLRAERGGAVDLHGAYVERLVLNVYGGAGQTRVWIDDIDLQGGVSVADARVGAIDLVDYTATVANTGEDLIGPDVRQEGSVLLVGGQPFFPRVLEYRGEPLPLVKELGFNTIWLAGATNEALAREAAALGLWIVCAPPSRASIAEMAAAGRSLANERAFAGVVAWDLGSGLTGLDLDATRAWALDVRAADRPISRPMVASAEVDLRGYSRAVDVLVSRKLPIGSSFELSEFSAWLAERPRLAHAGTPNWGTVQTQLTPALVEQQMLAAPRTFVPRAVEPDQIRLLALSAVAGGARGLVFESKTSLAAEDAETRARAATLALVNTELEWIEPWLAGGSVTAMVDGNDPQVRAAVLHLDRGQILLPLWRAPYAQFVVGQSAGNNVAFVVPGVPESSTVYEMTPGRLAPLPRQRVAGGVRVTTSEFGLASIFLMTQDQLVYTTMAKRLNESGLRAARLHGELARARFALVERVHAELTSLGQGSPQGASLIETARGQLAAAERALAANDLNAPHMTAAAARAAIRPLAALERADWERVVRGLSSPTAHPLAVCYQTLPAYARFVASSGGSTPLPNVLPAGDFEDLNVGRGVGWQRYEHQTLGVVSEAELSRDAPHGGGFSLKLVVRPIDETATDLTVESAPQWITSPSVMVGAAQWIRIRGFVRVPRPITGSHDGLLILDSLTGEALAERIRHTNGWREFELLRIAPRDSQVWVTFALTGLGEAWIDDVTIEPLAR